jgi:hypothetical protein
VSYVALEQIYSCLNRLQTSKQLELVVKPSITGRGRKLDVMVPEIVLSQPEAMYVKGVSSLQATGEVRLFAL